ncbi:hypothetical protein JYG30_10840 [Fibrella sp. USSR17]
MPTQTKPYRYQLVAKTIKIDCPQCGPKHRKSLSRYVDTQTGEALPEVYGRCDRASNCGYDLNPYHKDPSGMSYADEIRERNQMPHIQKSWFRMAGKQKRNGLTRRYFVETVIEIEGATPQQAEAVARFIFDKPVIPAKPTLSRPVCTIPDEVFNPSIGHYGQNQFARLLVRRFGKEQANALLDRFQIGTSARWPGACVFWYIDEQGRKRGGQIKLFNDDWHTAKYIDRKGQTRSKTDWVHTVLRYRLEKAGSPLPDWLTAYIDNADCSPCLFGLPQLSNAPVDQPIAIVEAPKTAVICSALIPGFIWLAVGALSYLNVERLTPLHGRAVKLFPDLSKDGKAYARWNRVANQLNKQGYNISTSDFLENRGNDEQQAQGLDLADFLLSEPPIVKTIADWIARPGSICKPDESQLTRLSVDPADHYPPDWDMPNDTSDLPTLRVRQYKIHCEYSVKASNVRTFD